MQPITPEEVLRKHAEFERECIEAAKLELADKPPSGIAYIKALIRRAQQIKEERKANGQG